MNERIQEALGILQEECGEVVVAVSKINRFGAATERMDTGKTNLQQLEQELGDVLAMIDILHEMDLVSYNNLEAAAMAKKEKLKKWSKIYTD